ncbi:MAG: hypothetical protein KAS93_00240 [Gammaproteobacteria bacterium]|nr:hypothetical protein [Gammaproteobacteria bacterium]
MALINNRVQDDLLPPTAPLAAGGTEEGATITPISSTPIPDDAPPVTGGATPPPADAVTATPISAPSATPAPAPAAPAAPAVQPETVEDRLNALTSGDSKYINLARSDAVRTANKRGLINSSMAAGQGTEAAIRAALPIAQQDAAATNEFGLNQQSADLNMSVASWNNMLDIEKIQFSETIRGEIEAMLANNNLSNDAKTNALNNVQDLISATEAIVLEIGLSDDTPAVQAAMIQDAYDTRDANIAVWTDLLNSIPDYSWSADLTPASVTPASPDANAPVPVGAINDGNGNYHYPDTGD